MLSLIYQIFPFIYWMSLNNSSVASEMFVFVFNMRGGCNNSSIVDIHIQLRL